ncbi:MAG: hypothetical protein N3A69_16905, partial [Leptospiraceae bacterium]|nr:hypothetical protein [Leptospiraceae bacterium]
MKFKVLLFLGIISFTLITCKRQISISMVNSTSSESNLAFSVLNGDRWEAEKNAEYVKFHIYPDEVFELSEANWRGLGT